VSCCSLAKKTCGAGALAELLSFLDGGEASKQQVPEKIGLELFFERSPARKRGADIAKSAGGEDKGYFASDAGGRRFESCHGNYARVAQWIEHLMSFVACSPAA
jgi:hypothetical protein